MSRIFSNKESRKRRKFANKAAKIEDNLNKLICSAYKTGLYPGVSIGVMPEVKKPAVKIWFFRDSDSIQNA